jgi:hypothetical protein
MLEECTCCRVSSGLNDVVPVSMGRVAFEVHAFHFFIRNLHSRLNTSDVPSDK